MSRQVRSRLDIRLGRQLTIGQELRHRITGQVWTIDQLYRTDCEALLDNGVERTVVPFRDLRTDYDLVVPISEVTAA